MPVFIRKDPDKGYFARNLWLPRRYSNTTSIKQGLEFEIFGDDGLEHLQLWKESGDHLIVPREYVPRSEYVHRSFPIINAQPTRFDKVPIRSRIVLDFKDRSKRSQREAMTSMINSTGGLLNLACGKGKTVMALAYSAYKQVPTIVIVHNTTLIDQWRDERIPEFLDVPGGVGTIQGPPDTWDWQGRGIVLAMVHSLALHRNSDQFLNGLSNYFGLVFFDEVHHLSAPLFVQTAPLFVGERHGLTATVNREDGLEPIYQYHIGEVYHRDLEQELTPEIYFLMNPLHLDRSSAAARHPETGIYDKNMKLNIPRLRNFLGRLPENNEFIAGRIRKPLEAGRKVLALSHSVEQLRILHEMFPGSGICTGRESAASRLQALRECNLTFGTLQLVKEGLDESALDTLFFLTPFGSSQVEDGGRNTLQQAMGRILRTRPDKKRPIVTILDHVYVDKFHRMCTNLKKQLDNWPTDQNGPLHYELMRPYSGDKQYG